MKDEQVCLLDIYGVLLTPKQQEVLRLHLEEDYSLREISEQSGTSRQAVHDMILRSLEKLSLYEEQLGLYRRLQWERQVCQQLTQILSEAGLSKNVIEQVTTLLDEMVEEE